jgi:hypothetical protein
VAHPSRRDARAHGDGIVPESTGYPHAAV